MHLDSFIEVTQNAPLQFQANHVNHLPWTQPIFWETHEIRCHRS